MVGFFYRKEREGAQRGFMGLGINREEREGPRRGIVYLGLIVQKAGVYFRGIMKREGIVI